MGVSYHRHPILMLSYLSHITKVYRDKIMFKMTSKEKFAQVQYTYFVMTRDSDFIEIKGE